MFWTVALGVVGLIGALVLYASTRPDTFDVERSALINVPPAKLFALISDLGSFDSWSPWARLDPAMRKSVSDPASGVGATYAWEGDKHVGSGRMEIVELVPDSQMRLKLAFFSPFKANNEVIYTLEPVGDATRMTWAMTGPLNLMSKIMHLVMNMDRMVGSQFAEGLANLKRVAEA